MVTILMPNSKLLQRLDDAPVLGVSLGNVSLFRLDSWDEDGPGNKYFKLLAYLQQARASGRSILVSFGGAWSNHLHALAAIGAREGLATVGIVRGGDGEQRSATLKDCADLGMSLEFVSRGEYRQRYEASYLEKLAARFPDALVIPEGGGDALGVTGCREIGRLLSAQVAAPGRVVIAVGTGTTLAGIASELTPGWELIGISALRGAHDLDARIARAVADQSTDGPVARWRVLHDFHCGGFARVSPALKAFILAFESVHGVQLDPVYSAKALFAVHSLQASGDWSQGEPLTVVHTGGLQGRRGFDWLA